MGRFLFALLLLAACVVALGFYLGWFTFSTTNNSENGRTNINIGVNRNKINSDVDKAEQKIKDAAGRVKDRIEKR